MYGPGNTTAMGQQLCSNAIPDADVATGAIPARSRSAFKVKRLTGRPKSSPSPSPTSTPPPPPTPIITPSPSPPTPEPPKPEQSLPPKRPNILTLPLEVRNNIYSHILAFPRPLIIYRASSTRILKTDFVSPYPHRLDLKIAPLFLTNKQVSREARTYFYSHNAFFVPSPALWPPNWDRLPLMRRWFIDRIGKHNSCALRHLRVVFPLDPENYVRWEKSNVVDGRRRSLFPGLAERCPNLTVLEFDPRSGSLFVRYLMTCSPDARSRTLKIISEELRAEFPVLEELVINLFELQYHSAWYIRVGILGRDPEEKEEIRKGGGSIFRPTIQDITPPVELGMEGPAAAEARIRELGWTIRSAGPDNDKTIYREVFWWGPEELEERERVGVEEYGRPVPRVRYRSIDLGHREERPPAESDE